MKLLASLALLGVTVVAQPVRAEMITINVNRVCAGIVGIPYASDNFSDEEWDKFQKCRSFIERYNGIE